MNLTNISTTVEPSSTFSSLFDDVLTTTKSSANHSVDTGDTSLLSFLVPAVITLFVFCLSLALEFDRKKPLGEWLRSACENQLPLANPLAFAVLDTASDVGVVIMYGTIMRAEHRPDDFEHLNMEAFFVVGVICLLLFYLCFWSKIKL